MNMNFRTAFRPLVLVLCAGSALGAACSSGPASAANGSEMTVSYQDLNLANQADVRVLRLRPAMSAAMCRRRNWRDTWPSSAATTRPWSVR